MFQKLFVAVVTLTGLFFTDFAIAAVGSDSVFESFAAFPSERDVVQLPAATRMPQYTMSQFGFSETVACGPGVATNSLACFNLRTHSPMGERPTPGAITTAPVFYKNSVLFGTSKGFFISVGLRAGESVSIGKATTGFWGDSSRKDMFSLAPKLDVAQQGAEYVAAKAKALESGWNWYHVGSSEFIGKPVIQGEALFAMSASQILHAFDVSTGKLLWTTRVAPDATLRLDSLSLMVTTREVIVGSNDGTVQGFGFADGKNLWRFSLPTAAENRFMTIAASPFVDNRSIVVSNSDNVTQRISLENQKVEWTYNFPSVATPRQVDKYLLLGGSDGAMAALDVRTGEQRWKTRISVDSSIASIRANPESKSILVATHDGTLFLLSMDDGKVLYRSHKFGDVVGEFSENGVNGSCLSFAAPGFRCFVTMIPDTFAK